MKKFFILCAPVIFLVFKTQAQYTANYGIPVQDIYGVELKYPWTGGLNNPQFSDGDLNNDGIKDLFVFDRTGNKIYTFINHGTANTVDYEYAPEYEAGFPQLINWALLRDYNCDGIPDIFSFTTGPLSNPGFGIQVHRGFYSGDNKIHFECVDSLIRFPYQNTTLNLFVSPVDVPAIADVNGDGDLDVLTFQSTGGFVMYFENQSKESGYGCDSLIYVKSDDCWGDFFEPSLQKTDLLNQTCPFLQGNEAQKSEGQERHTGSAETAWDNDGDGDLEFLKGDISFSNLDYMINGGTNTDAHMVQEDTAYPSADVPADVFIFPVPFVVDVNNDGLLDLLVAPNAAGGSVNLTCSWYYKNVGNAIAANFVFQTNTFLNSDMIDLGEGCYPVFFDADNDGLLDMIIGNRGYFDNSNINIYVGQLAFFKNVGDAQNPAFRLVTNDYANISSLNVKSVYPAFADLDGDGDKDMVLGQEDGSLLFFKNTAPANSPANFVFFGANYQSIDVGNNATPQFADVNRDGLVDLLIGEQSGNLDYYQNTGTATTPVFTSTNPFFGGVDVRQPGYLEGASVPYLFDDNDGAGYQLLVGSKRGWIYKYTHIDSNLTGTFTKVDSFFNKINEGANATVSGADVNGDGKVDLLVGNYRGGCTFYDSKLTGIDQTLHEQDEEITVYPNPASEYFTLLFSDELNPSQLRLSMFDISGREVLSNASFTNVNGKFNVSQLASGLYFIRVSTGKQTLVKKISISR